MRPRLPQPVAIIDCGFAAPAREPPRGRRILQLFILAGDAADWLAVDIMTLRSWA